MSTIALSQPILTYPKDSVYLIGLEDSFHYRCAECPKEIYPGGLYSLLLWKTYKGFMVVTALDTYGEWDRESFIDFLTPTDWFDCKIVHGQPRYTPNESWKRMPGPLKEYLKKNIEGWNGNRQWINMIMNQLLSG